MLLYAVYILTNIFNLVLIKNFPLKLWRIEIWRATLIRTQVEHTGNVDPGQLTLRDPFTAFYT